MINTLTEIHKLNLSQPKDVDVEFSYFLDSKQLQKFLRMSWNTINSVLLCDPNFPAMRYGAKWLFPRKKIEEYMDNFYIEVQKDGGDIKKFIRKK